MVDSEYNTHNYKCSSISSGAKMNNSEILRLVPDHLDYLYLQSVLMGNIPLLNALRTIYIPS